MNVLLFFQDVVLFTLGFQVEDMILSCLLAAAIWTAVFLVGLLMTELRRLLVGWSGRVPASGHLLPLMKAASLRQSCFYTLKGSRRFALSGM